MTRQPISPLQGGRRRRIGWDGPTLAGPRGTRRRLARRVGALAGVAAAVGGWLTLGSDDLGDSTRLGILTPPVVQTEERRDGESRADRARAAREREAAAIAVPLAGEAALQMEFEDPPAGGLLFDVDSGEVLWRRDPTGVRPIASLTKIMTAVLVTEELRGGDRRVRIGKEPVETEGSAVGLEPGMRVEANSLFHAMFISSANDAATALAIEVAGSAERFVSDMNRRARELGLGCTRFVSAHGLEPGNVSCAADMAALMRLAMESGRIRHVAAKPRAVVDFPQAPNDRRHLASTNPLHLSDYPGTVGLKTGYTIEAGRSLAAVVRRDGRTLAAVLLDSPEPGAQAERLFDAAFEDAASERESTRERSPRRGGPRRGST